MNDEELLRHYLTGTLTEETVEDVELRLLADEDFFELAEVVGRDVLADCALGALGRAEEAGVRQRAAASAGGRARLALAEDLTALSGLARATGSRRDGVPADLAHLQGPALCEALVARSLDLRSESQQQALCLAALAVAVASGLDPGRDGATVVADLRCRTRIELANAYRLVQHLAEAERCFAEAAALLPAGAGGDPLRARLFDLRGALLGDLRRFPEAMAEMDAAYALHRRLGDDHSAGRTLITKGRYAGHANETDEAIRLMQEGLALIDATREPRLVLACVHNIALFQLDRKEYASIRHFLNQNLWLYERYAGPLDLLKLQGLQAVVSAGLGDLDEAERGLSAVRAELIAADLPYLAALTTLDLGEVRLRQGRAAEARALVREAVEVFRSLKIDREALAAVLFLEKTFETEWATTVLLRQVADFLRRAENDPEAKFTPPV